MALLLWSPGSHLTAAEFDVRIGQNPQKLVVENPWPQDTPTVYIVGRPDTQRDPVRLTKGVTLNGIRMTERLLSESVLILYPNGTGKWGYHAGFDIFREPDFRDGERIDPRTLVEYSKWQYDPLEPVSVVGGDMTHLQLFNRRPFAPLVYEVAFPDPIKIRTLTVTSNCDQIGQPDTQITVKLFADPQRRDVLAEQRRGGERGGFPVVFEALDRGRVTVEISAAAPADKNVHLYWTFLEADLDTTGLKLPVLEPGRNVVQVKDDEDSSHQARIVLRWFEKPTKDRIWDDFEGESSWTACRPVAGSPQNGLSFTGSGFARINFPAVGRDYMLHRGFSQPLDLTKFNRLSLASRVRRGAPMVAIQFGIQNGQGKGYQYSRLSPGERWNYQTFDLGRFERDQVTAFNVYFTAVAGYDHPQVICEYDIDALGFFHVEPQRREAVALPAHVSNHQSPYTDRQPPERPLPPLQEWFPLGVYSGILVMAKQEAVYLLDQMKKFHMNTIYVSGGILSGLEKILPLAETRGIRLVYQGTGAGNLYYLPYATEEARLAVLNGQVLPSARENIPRFKNRWGLLAWSLTEEINADMSRELSPYYELVRQLDPAHPPTVLHNNLNAAKADLQTNRPVVVTHDFYPFFWAPRHGPSNPGRSISAYRGRVTSFYRACRDHGASLWMMPQAWGGIMGASLDPPNYGYRTGTRTPEPGEIKQQGWLAIAGGATGIMYFADVARDPQEHHLWDYHWQETNNTRAAGELFEAVTKVAPLLCRLERDYQEEEFVRVAKGPAISHSFVKREGYPGTAHYVVVASLDGFETQTVALDIQTGARVYDMITRQQIEPAALVEFQLPAGEGMVLLVGRQEDFEADCRMIDEQLKRYY